MNRTTATTLSATVAATLLCTGCGADGARVGASPAALTTTASGEKVTLTVNGAVIPVQRAKDYSCKTADDGVQLFNWTSGTPTPGPTATVSLGKKAPAAVAFGAEGIRYSVAENRPGTDATAAKDGDEYVIEGTALSWDITPPKTARFRITFTCNTDPS